MEKVRFSNCLDKEIKFYNLPVGGLIGAVIIGGTVSLFKGMIWATGFGAIGYLTGSYLTKQWWLGNLQRKCYWKLPLVPGIAGRKLPPSHRRSFN
jgi:hypothetical protein